MKKSILLVDDDKGILTLLKFILEEKYTVLLAENGVSGLQKLNDTARKPDLIISDLSMPYLNGSSFIRQVKISGFFRHIPILVLSANEDLEEQVKAMPFPLHGFLQKPFNPPALLTLIAAILDAPVINKPVSN